MKDDQIKKCDFCLNPIPLNAQKCSYCLEWQEKPVEKIEKAKMTIEEVVDFSHSKPFQYRLVQFFPLNYWVSVLIIGVLIFTIMQVSWFILGEDKIYLVTFLSFSLQIVFCWAGIIWLYNLINDNYTVFIQISSVKTEIANEIFHTYQKKIFNNRKALLVALFLGTSAVILDYFVGMPFEKSESKFIYLILAFLNMFFAGAGVYSITNFAIFIYKISRIESKRVLSFETSQAIQAVGKSHLKSSLLVIIPFILGCVAKLGGNWTIDMAMYIWYGVFAIIIIVYIYWPMVNIHYMMKDEVERQVMLIQSKIKSSLNEININPTSRNFIKLNELNQLEKSLSSQNTWPFDLKSISAAFFAIILPIVLLIIEKIWSNYNL